MVSTLFSAGAEGEEIRRCFYSLLAAASGGMAMRGIASFPLAAVRRFPSYGALWLIVHVQRRSSSNLWGGGAALARRSPLPAGTA